MVAESRHPLIGRPVEVIVSDPWEFGLVHGVGPFKAVVQRADGSALALKLEATLAFQGVVFDVIVAQSRHVGMSLSDLLNGRKVDVNATPVVQGTEDPFEAAKRWRAWHLVAQVMLDSSDHIA